MLCAALQTTGQFINIAQISVYKGPGEAEIADFKHSRKPHLPCFSSRGRKSITVPVLPPRLFAYEESPKQPSRTAGGHRRAKGEPAVLTGLPIDTASPRGCPLFWHVWVSPSEPFSQSHPLIGVWEQAFMFPGPHSPSGLGVLSECLISGDQPTGTGQPRKHRSPWGQGWESCARSLLDNPFATW